MVNAFLNKFTMKGFINILGLNVTETIDFHTFLYFLNVFPINLNKPKYFRFSLHMINQKFLHSEKLQNILVLTNIYD